MMKHRIKTSLAMAVAFAASALVAAPTAMAEAQVTKQVQKGQKLVGSRHDRDRDRDRDDRDEDWDDRDYDDDDRRGRGRTALINCGSGDYETNSCRINVRFKVKDARVHKRRSKSDCDRGRDWGLRGDRIWVRDGCRAVFEVSNTYYPGRRHRDRDGYRDGHRDSGPWRGRDRGWGDYHNISRYEIRSAIRACERYGASLARDRGRDGAVYLGRPSVDIGRRGAIRIKGDMKTWGRKRARYVETFCKVRRGYVVSFDVSR